MCRVLTLSSCSPTIFRWITGSSSAFTEDLIPCCPVLISGFNSFDIGSKVLL